MSESSPEKNTYDFDGQELRLARTLEDAAECSFGCGCDKVYPFDWVQADDNTWQVTLRCPNCEGIDDVAINGELIERFDLLLDRGTDRLVRDLRNLTYANMATEINTFVLALNEDQILPEDF